MDHGLFNANEIKMTDVEAVASEPGAEQPRIVAVDPGVANVFTSVAMDLDEFKRLSGQVQDGTRKGCDANGQNRGQYYARTGVRAHRYRGEESYRKLDEKTYGERCGPLRSHRTKLRNRGWIHPMVREAHRRLGKEGLFKVSGATVAVEQLGRRMDIIFQSTLAWGLSRNAARHRFYRDHLKHSAMDAMVHELAPRDNDIVVFGNFLDDGPSTERRWQRR